MGGGSPPNSGGFPKGGDYNDLLVLASFSIVGYFFLSGNLLFGLITLVLLAFFYSPSSRFLSSWTSSSDFDESNKIVY